MISDCKQPGWLAVAAASSLSAAPALGETSPSGSYDLLFSSSTLAEQTRLVDPASVSGAQRVDLQGLRLGGLKLDINLQKTDSARAGYPVLRYTTAAARREWLQSITSRGPRKMALAGQFDAGAARGLAFAFSNQRGDGKSASDNRLSYARDGLEASLRMRRFDEGLTRSSLMSDAEWKDVKGMLGWRQTDMSLAWKGTPGLSMSAATSRGRNASTGQDRASRALDLAWKPKEGTDLSFHSNMSTSGKGGTSSRTGTQRLALKQTFGGLGLNLSQETIENVKGRSGRTNRLSLATSKDAFAAFRADFTEARINGRTSAEQAFAVQTREKAPMWLGLQHVRSRDGDRSKNLSAVDFRASPNTRLSLNGGLATTTGNGGSTRDANLKLDWKPGGDWRLQGALRETTGAPQTMADLHLTGRPDRATSLDARIQRPVDPKNPYRRQDAVRVERALSGKSKASAEYAALETKDGAAANVAQVSLNATMPAGKLPAHHRSGGRGVVPDPTELSYTRAPVKGSGLKLDARWKRTDGAPNTEILSASWDVRPGLCLEASYARNPEDKKGVVQNLSRQSVGLHVDLKPGLRLDLAYADESRPGFESQRADLVLKGRMNRLTEVDPGLTTRAATGLPEDPAYRVAVRHVVDDEHRLLLEVDRKTRAVHGRDDLTARFELITDF